MKQKILHDCSKLIIAQTPAGTKRETQNETTKQCLALKSALLLDPEAPALLLPQGGDQCPAINEMPPEPAHPAHAPHGQVR